MLDFADRTGCGTFTVLWPQMLLECEHSYPIMLESLGMTTMRLPAHTSLSVGRCAQVARLPLSTPSHRRPMAVASAGATSCGGGGGCAGP